MQSHHELADRIKHLAKTIRKAETRVLLRNANATGRLLSDCREAFQTGEALHSGQSLVERIDGLQATIGDGIDNALHQWTLDQKTALSELAGQIRNLK